MYYRVWIFIFVLISRFLFTTKKEEQFYNILDAMPTYVSSVLRLCLFCLLILLTLQTTVGLTNSMNITPKKISGEGRKKQCNFMFSFLKPNKCLFGIFSFLFNAKLC